MQPSGWRRMVFLALSVSMLAVLSASPALGETSLADLQNELCPGKPGPRYVTPELCSMKVAQIRLEIPGGTAARLDAFVASNAAQRQAGYQFIGPDVIAESAMLFVFPSPQNGAFHMCNVASPLEIAWFRPDGRLLDAQLMLPGRRGSAALCNDVYRPRAFGVYLFALEMPQGSLERLGFSWEALSSLRLALDDGS